MKRIAIGILLTVLLVAPAWAASGTLTTSGSACTVTGVTCLIVHLTQKGQRSRRGEFHNFRNVDRDYHV